MSNLLFLLENVRKMRYNGVEKQRKGRDAREKEQHGYLLPHVTTKIGSLTALKNALRLVDKSIIPLFVRN